MTKKILIVGPTWVGDMVMAQSLFKTILKKEPNAQLDVLAPDWCRAVLKRMPEVTNIVPLPLKSGELALAKRHKIARELRRENYRQAYVLPNSWKSALIPFWAKIPVRTGWLGEMRFGLLNDWHKLDKIKYPKMVQRFVALAEQGVSFQNCPVPCFATDPSQVSQTLSKFKLSTEQPILALCPGAAFGPSKRWPHQRFIELAQQKINEGWQIWFFGSPADREITTLVADKLIGNVTNLAGQLELSETVDLMSVTSAVISNDSGLMHIAAALQRPLVAIYGSTTPSFTPPLGAAKILQTELPCRPCFKRECPLEHHHCMQKITMVKVREQLEEAINECAS